MSRRSRLGQRFLALGEFDLLYVVTFRLPARRCIYQLLQQLDKHQEPTLDLYFAIQYINVRQEMKDEPIFVGAFQYASNGKLLQQQLQGITVMQVTRVDVMTVSCLFEAMSRVSYREYQMFERLKFGCFFSRSTTYNPFAQAVLARDVLHIYNLAEQQRFCHSQYTRFIRSKEHKNTHRSPRQGELQIALYGEPSRHYQIYICPEDEQWMKMRQKVEEGKMEDCQSTTSSNEDLESSSSSSSSGEDSDSSEDSSDSNSNNSNPMSQSSRSRSMSDSDQQQVIEQMENLHIRGRTRRSGYDSEDELDFCNGLNQQR